MQVLEMLTVRRLQKAFSAMCPTSEMQGMSQLLQQIVAEFYSKAPVTFLTDTKCTALPHLSETIALCGMPISLLSPLPSCTRHTAIPKGLESLSARLSCEFHPYFCPISAAPANRLYRTCTV